MGYNLTIGEAEIEHNKDFCRIDARIETHEDAPSHCKYTKNGNCRSVGYSAWSAFCKKADITTLFYGGGWQYPGYAPCPDGFHRETCLLAEHPGAQPITKADADYVSKKLEEYRAKNPNSIAGFWDEGNVDNGKDYILARFLWLDFWMRWAVENCENPVFANS